MANKKINTGAIATSANEPSRPKLTSDIIADYLERMGGQATLVKPDGSQYSPNRKGRVNIGDRMTTAEKFGQAADVGLSNEFQKLPEVHARFDDRQVALQVQKELATGRLTTQKFFESPDKAIADQAAEEIRRSDGLLGRGESVEVRKLGKAYEVVAVKQYQPVPSRGNSAVRSYGLDNDPEGRFVAFNKPEEAYAAPKSLKELQAEARRLEASGTQALASDTRTEFKPQAQSNWEKLELPARSPMTEQLLQVAPEPRAIAAQTLDTPSDAWKLPQAKEPKLPHFYAQMASGDNPLGTGSTVQSEYDRAKSAYQGYQRFGYAPPDVEFPKLRELTKLAESEGVKGDDALKAYIKGKQNAPLIEAGVLPKPELPMTARLGQQYISPKSDKVGTVESVGKKGVKLNVDGQAVPVEYQTLEKLKYTGNKGYGFAAPAALRPVIGGFVGGTAGSALFKQLAKSAGLTEEQQNQAAATGGIIGSLGGSALTNASANTKLRVPTAKEFAQTMVSTPQQRGAGARLFDLATDESAIFSKVDRANILNNKLPQYDIKPVLSEAAVIAVDMATPSPYGVATVPALRTATELWQQNFDDVTEKGIAGLVNRRNVDQTIAKTKSLKDLTYQSLTAIAKGVGLPFPMTEQIVGDVVDRVPSGQQIMDLAKRFGFGTFDTRSGVIQPANPVIMQRQADRLKAKGIDARLETFDPSQGWYQEFKEAVTGYVGNSPRSSFNNATFLNDTVRDRLVESANRLGITSNFDLRDANEMYRALPEFLPQDTEFAKRVKHGAVYGYATNDLDGKSLAFARNDFGSLKANSVIAHEIGHIVAGHTNRNDITPTPLREFEADAISYGVHKKLGVANNPLIKEAYLRDFQQHLGMDEYSSFSRYLDSSYLDVYNPSHLQDAVDRIIPESTRTLVLVRGELPTKSIDFSNKLVFESGLPQGIKEIDSILGSDRVYTNADLPQINDYLFKNIDNLDNLIGSDIAKRIVHTFPDGEIGLASDRVLSSFNSLKQNPPNKLRLEPRMQEQYSSPKMYDVDRLFEYGQKFQSPRTGGVASLVMRDGQNVVLENIDGAQKTITISALKDNLQIKPPATLTDLKRGDGLISNKSDLRYTVMGTTGDAVKLRGEDGTIKTTTKAKVSELFRPNSLGFVTYPALNVMAGASWGSVFGYGTGKALAKEWGWSEDQQNLTGIAGGVIGGATGGALGFVPTMLSGELANAPKSIFPRTWKNTLGAALLGNPVSGRRLGMTSETGAIQPANPVVMKRQADRLKAQGYDVKLETFNPTQGWMDEYVTEVQKAPQGGKNILAVNAPLDDGSIRKRLVDSADRMGIVVKQADGSISDILPKPNNLELAPNQRLRGTAYVDPKTKAQTIAVDAAFPKFGVDNTIAHEMGHILAGHTDGSRGKLPSTLKELEANAVAYGVQKKLGVAGNPRLQDAYLERYRSHLNMRQYQDYRSQIGNIDSERVQKAVDAILPYSVESQRLVRGERSQPVAIAPEIEGITEATPRQSTGAIYEPLKAQGEDMSRFEKPKLKNNFPKLASEVESAVNKDIALEQAKANRKGLSYEDHLRSVYDLTPDEYERSTRLMWRDIVAKDNDISFTQYDRLMTSAEADPEFARSEYLEFARSEYLEQKGRGRGQPPKRIGLFDAPYLEQKGRGRGQPPKRIGLFDAPDDGKFPLKKIISGGQTGADQVGLEVAKKFGIDTGGYAPPRFMTEAGQNMALRDEYGLTDIKSFGNISAEMAQRTRQNARAADGTVIFTEDINSKGTQRTIKEVGSRPLLVNPESPQQLRDFIQENRIATLNVAGNRASKAGKDFPDRVRNTLTDAIAPVLPTVDESLKGRTLITGKGNIVQYEGDKKFQLPDLSIRQVTDDQISRMGIRKWGDLGFTKYPALTASLFGSAGIVGGATLGKLLARQFGANEDQQNIAAGIGGVIGGLTGSSTGLIGQKLSMPKSFREIASRALLPSRNSQAGAVYTIGGSRKLAEASEIVNDVLRKAVAGDATPYFVLGDAKGGDAIAKQFAIDNDIPYRVMAADKAELGNLRYIVRDYEVPIAAKQIAATGAYGSEIKGVYISADDSKGTQHMINAVMESGIPAELTRVKSNIPAIPSISDPNLSASDRKLLDDYIASGKDPSNLTAKDFGKGAKPELQILGTAPATIDEKIVQQKGRGVDVLGIASQYQIPQSELDAMTRRSQSPTLAELTGDREISREEFARRFPDKVKEYVPEATPRQSTGAIYEPPASTQPRSLTELRQQAAVGQSAMTPEYRQPLLLEPINKAEMTPKRDIPPLPRNFVPQDTRAPKDPNKFGYTPPRKVKKQYSYTPDVVPVDGKLLNLSQYRAKATEWRRQALDVTEPVRSLDYQIPVNDKQMRSALDEALLETYASLPKPPMRSEYMVDRPIQKMKEFLNRGSKPYVPNSMSNADDLRQAMSQAEALGDVEAQVNIAKQLEKVQSRRVVKKSSGGFNKQQPKQSTFIAESAVEAAAKLSGATTGQVKAQIASQRATGQAPDLDRAVEAIAPAQSKELAIRPVQSKELAIAPAQSKELAIRPVQSKGLAVRSLKDMQSQSKALSTRVLSRQTADGMIVIPSQSMIDAGMKQQNRVDFGDRIGASGLGILMDTAQAAQVLTESASRGEKAPVALTRAGLSVGAGYATTALASYIPNPYLRTAAQIGGGIAAVVGADKAIDQVVGRDAAREDKFAKDLSKLDLNPTKEADQWKPFANDSNMLAAYGNSLAAQIQSNLDYRPAARSLANLANSQSIDNARYASERGQSIDLSQQVGAGRRQMTGQSSTVYRDRGDGVTEAIGRRRAFSDTESRVLALQNLANESGYEVPRTGKFDPKLSEALEKLGYGDRQIGDYIQGRSKVIGKPAIGTDAPNQKDARAIMVKRANEGKPKITSAELSQALRDERQRQGLKGDQMLDQNTVASTFSSLATGARIATGAIATAGRSLSQMQGKPSFANKTFAKAGFGMK